MNFPNVITPPCENPLANAACPPNGTGLPDDGAIDVPSTDPRCSDPAFASANPDLCRSYPLLVLKPESAMTEPGKNVTYRAFLQTGAIEIEITKGLTWSISDVSIAVVNQIGVATGVAAGECTVSAVWEGFWAHAILEVVAECVEVNTCFLILIDNSKSSTQNFSAQYGTKLAYAKAITQNFIDFVNTDKDTFAVGKFNSGCDILITETIDRVAAKAAANGISSSNGKTNISTALEVGTAYLDSLTDKHRVLILITDFEQNQGDDPVPIARTWKEQGNTIVVVAMRCWGEFFLQAYRTASGGYFLSAYASTGYAVSTTLVGVKSFLCGGSCQPDAGTFPTAALDYTGFINWDVVEGNVDLVGLEKWDVFPGHGLYVDMCGTDAAHHGAAARGKIRSKVAYPVEDGKEYRFSLKVAGNGRPYTVQGDYAIQVTVGAYVDEKIVISDPEKGFNDAPSPYEYEFTATADGTVYLAIESLPQPTPKPAQVGLLVDEIEFKCLTDDDVLLYDDFDAENLTTVLPGPNYYGCLLVPPAAQTADPTPPPTLSE